MSINSFYRNERVRSSAQGCYQTVLRVRSGSGSLRQRATGTPVNPVIRRASVERACSSARCCVISASLIRTAGGTTWYPVLERHPNDSSRRRVSFLSHRDTGFPHILHGQCNPPLSLSLSLSAPRDVTLCCHGYFVTIDVSFLVEIGAMWSAAVAGTPFAWLFR